MVPLSNWSRYLWYHLAMTVLSCLSLSVYAFRGVVEFTPSLLPWEAVVIYLGAALVFHLIQVCAVGITILLGELTMGVLTLAVPGVMLVSPGIAWFALCSNYTWTMVDPLPVWYWILAGSVGFLQCTCLARLVSEN